MAGKVEILADEVALIVEALEDAAYFRDSRSRAIKSAVRRRSRSLSPKPGAEGDAPEPDRLKAKAYEALAIKLRR